MYAFNSERGSRISSLWVSQILNEEAINISCYGLLHIVAFHLENKVKCSVAAVCPLPFLTLWDCVR